MQLGQEPVQVLVPHGAQVGNAVDDLGIPHGEALAQRGCHAILGLSNACLNLQYKVCPGLQVDAVGILPQFCIT